MKRQYKYHHVTDFVDNGEVFVVVKYYGKRLQWWHYEVWDKDEYEEYIRRKNLNKAGKLPAPCEKSH